MSGAALAWLWSQSLARSPRIRTAIAEVVGHLYEIAVYRDVPFQILRCLARLARASALLARHLLVPGVIVLILALPLLSLLRASQARLPLHVGENVLVSLRLAHGQDVFAPRIELPDGLILTGPPVRVPSIPEIFWRIAALRDGQFSLRAGGVSKRVDVGEGAWLLCPARRTGWWTALVAPGESALPPGPAVELAIGYQVHELRVDQHFFSWETVLVFWTVVWSIPMAALKTATDPGSTG